MRELRPIDGWVSKVQSYNGRYRDENGNGLCGTWLREYKDSYDVVILSNGDLDVQYKYPKISNLPFENKMVRWQNLYHCGGYGLIDRDGISLMDEEQSIVDAVCAGLKPIGFVVTKDEGKIEKFKRQVNKAGLPYALIYEPEREGVDFGIKYTTGGWFRMGIANHGTIDEVFDFISFVKSYRQLAEKIDVCVEEGFRYISERINMNLSDFITNYGEVYEYNHHIAKEVAIYQYNHYIPKDVAETMFTGLILGYPIEATFSRLFYK